MTVLYEIRTNPLHGVDAFRISIEVNISKGLGMIIASLPDDGIRENYNRIFVALSAKGALKSKDKTGGQPRSLISMKFREFLSEAYN